MTNRTAILGIGETAYRPVDDRSLEELVHAASRDALADADLDRDAIDNVVVCASDLEDGRAISSMVAAGPAGSYRRDFIKTTDTGIHALALAAMRIEAGVFDTALVVSWAKQSECDEPTIRPLEADPFFRRGTGLGHVTGHAVVASGYARDDSQCHEAAHAVVEKNTANGRDAPVGHRSAVSSADQAGESPVVSWPLREDHLPDHSDGACALVLGRDGAASPAGPDPVHVRGLGWETGPYNLDGRVDGRLPALAGAADRAYREADVTPSDDIDLFEVHARSAYHELMACEALGVCDGPAADRAIEGRFHRDGATPVNPSGGPFAANPLIATGLARAAAATRQLRGESADAQVDGATTALAHSTAGFTDQVHGVAVLEVDAA